MDIKISQKDAERLEFGNIGPTALFNVKLNDVVYMKLDILSGDMNAVNLAEGSLEYFEDDDVVELYVQIKPLSISRANKTD